MTPLILAAAAVAGDRIAAGHPVLGALLLALAWFESELVEDYRRRADRGRGSP